MDSLKKFAELEPTKKAFSLLEEFKSFALKGSVIDLAVGVIIGAAFGTIVKSLVDNIMMPLIARESSGAIPRSRRATRPGISQSTEASCIPGCFWET